MLKKLVIALILLTLLSKEGRQHCLAVHVLNNGKPCGFPMLRMHEILYKLHPSQLPASLILSLPSFILIGKSVLWMMFFINA